MVEKNNEYSKTQLRYSSTGLTVQANMSGWDARISVGNYSIAFGNNYEDLSSSFGFGVNSNGIISGYTITNQTNVTNTIITLGIVGIGAAAILTGQYYLIPALLP